MSTPRNLTATALVITVFLAGCSSMNPTEPETKSIGGTVNDSRVTLAQPTGHSGVSSREKAGLILATARARQSMTGFAGHSELRATYVGRRGSCEAVTVENRQFNKVDHYEVCGGQIARRNDVAPARPSVGDYDRKAMERVKRDAIQYGSGAVQYQGYSYRANRIGVPNAQGCMPVEIMVSYDGLLVDRATEQVCSDP